MKKNILFTKYYILSLIVFISIGITSCSDSGFNPLDINLFTIQDDVRFGEQLDAEIKSKPNEYPLLNNNHSAVVQLNLMMNEILNSAEIKYKDEFNYNIQIINDRNTINAFAAPGGYIYVYTGLIHFLDNEATLAAVIAHEIAHAERRHATKRLTKMYGASVLLGMLLGNNPSLMEEIAANLLTGLGVLYNSRQDEYESDEYSFKYLLTSKWYAGSTIYFFDKISGSSEPSKIEILLHTHPIPQDRIDAVKELIAKHNLPEPNESNLFSQRYATFKQTVP